MKLYALLFSLLPTIAVAAPRLAIEPSAVIFDGARTATVRLSNQSNERLEIRRVALATGSTGFRVIDPGTLALEPGQSIDVRVELLPERAQSFGGLQIFCDDPRFPAADRAPGTHVAGVALRAGASSLLSWMIFAPLLAALVVLLLPAGLARWVALAGAAVPAVLGGWLFLRFDRSWAGLQFVQHLPWIRSFNVEYFVGVDGLSITMVLLTALISLIAVGASWRIDRQVKGYFVLFLLLETGMMGTFCALDFFLFYVFWEVMLLPMYFLIGIWGGARREYAAIKFFLYTLVGSVVMLLAIIALYYQSEPTTLVDGTPARHTFDVIKLAYANDWEAKHLTLLGMSFTHVVWVALFLGFAIKIPMFPFHTWLPDAHVEAPTAISVLLAGILLKMGVYGILRMNLAILPDATRWAALTMAVFGAINILYGAFCAFAQSDLKRLVAYSSVSHMGFCLVGLAAFTESGFHGAVLQMFNHGTITAMLFLLVGVLYDRAHTREIDRFGGVATQMPRYAAFFGFAFMASLGLPGLSGFIGEVLVFLGAFPVYRTITILACSGVIFTAAYHLWALQRVQLGAWNESWDRLKFPDLTGRETLTLAPLALIVLVLGFYPLPLLELVGPSLDELLHHVAPHP